MCGSTVAKRIGFMQAKHSGKLVVWEDEWCVSAAVMSSLAGANHYGGANQLSDSALPPSR
jgi:hypothetical protein